MMRQWCQCKEEEGPHLHAKTPRHVTIVANQATLHDFASRPKNNKEKENANKAKDDDDYAFATKDGDHCKAICKWIMD